MTAGSRAGGAACRLAARALASSSSASSSIGAGGGGLFSLQGSMQAARGVSGMSGGALPTAIGGCLPTTAAAGAAAAAAVTACEQRRRRCVLRRRPGGSTATAAAAAAAGSLPLGLASALGQQQQQQQLLRLRLRPLSGWQQQQQQQQHHHHHHHRPLARAAAAAGAASFDAGSGAAAGFSSSAAAEAAAAGGVGSSGGGSGRKGAAEEEEDDGPAGELVAVETAIRANALIFAAKLGVFFISNSSAMLAEAVHSLVDIANQMLLRVGIIKAQRRPNAQHPYGYVRDQFIWPLISAVGIFCCGAGVSFVHGVTGLFEAHRELGDLYWNFVVLGVSGVLESHSLHVAVKTLQRRARQQGMGFLAYIRTGADPAAVAVMMEDGAAVAGLAIAAGCLALCQATGVVYWDAVGSIAVSALLGVVAVLLIQRNRSLLIGRSMPQDAEGRILRHLLADRVVRSVSNVKSEELGARQYRFQADIAFAGEELARRALDRCGRVRLFKAIDAAVRRHDPHALDALLMQFAAVIVSTTGAEVDRIEREIMRLVPGTRWVDLETDRGKPARLSTSAAAAVAAAAAQKQLSAAAANGDAGAAAAVAAGLQAQVAAAAAAAAAAGRPLQQQQLAGLLLQQQQQQKQQQGGGSSSSSSSSGSGGEGGGDNNDHLDGLSAWPLGSMSSLDGADIGGGAFAGADNTPEWVAAFAPEQLASLVGRGGAAGGGGEAPIRLSPESMAAIEQGLLMDDEDEDRGSAAAARWWLQMNDGTAATMAAAAAAAAGAAGAPPLPPPRSQPTLAGAAVNAASAVSGGGEPSSAAASCVADLLQLEDDVMRSTMGGDGGGGGDGSGGDGGGGDASSSNVSFCDLMRAENERSLREQAQAAAEAAAAAQQQQAEAQAAQAAAEADAEAFREAAGGGK